MKKIITLLLALVMVLSMSACGKKKLQRSKEFLDYRTLKTTLKAEKEG